MRLFTTNRCPPTVALCAAFTMACGGPMPDEAEDVSELRRRGSYPTPRVDHSGPIDPPPANLRVAQNGHSMVSLAFQCGRFANRHELRAKQGNGRWRVVRRSLRCSSTSRRPQYAYQRVLPETRYCFRVKAINSTDTAQSNHVCFTSLADRTTPTPPLSHPGTLDLARRRAAAPGRPAKRRGRRRTLGWVRTARTARAAGGDQAILAKVHDLNARGKLGVWTDSRGCALRGDAWKRACSRPCCGDSGT